MKDAILGRKLKCALNFKLLFLLITHSFLLFCQTEQYSSYPSTFGKTHFIAGFEQYPITNHGSKNTAQHPGTYHALFSPNGNVCETLCSLIEQEQELILVAVYTITDK